MRESVIVSAVRLPTGKFLGSLKSLPAPELGAKVVREAVSRAGIEPGLVDECIMGNVVSAGAGQAPALGRPHQLHGPRGAQGGQVQAPAGQGRQLGLEGRHPAAGVEPELLRRAGLTTD